MKRILLLLLISIYSIGSIKSQSTVTSINAGNWSNSSTWDIGVPNSGDDVIINHSVFIDVKDTVNNLTINQTTFSSDTLFITGVLNLEADIFSNPIVFVNDDVNKGRLGQTSNGQIIGNFIWQKWIERCDGWGMYGGPFDSPLSDYGFFHTGFPGTSFPTFWINTYFYDETIPNIDRDTGFYAPSNVSDIILRTNSFMLFDSSSSSTNSARVIEMEGSLDLTQEVDFNITYSGQINNPENGWNMISNPYPGTIDWDAAGWTSQKVDNSIWVWDVCNRNYASYVNGVGVNGGTNLISSGQGFWVKSNKPNPALKSTRNVIVDQAMELRSSNSEVIRISLDNDEIALVINQDATSQYDTLYDSYKFLSDGSRLYSYLDSNIYSINSFSNKDTIPIWVKGDGVINFDLSEFSSNVYYQDVNSGLLYDVSSNPNYSFFSSSGDYYHRFNVILSNILSVDEINLQDSYIIGRYNLMGQEINENYKGVIIEVYSNGKRKILKF
jgi:hypothetical protein